MNLSQEKSVTSLSVDQARQVARRCTTTLDSSKLQSDTDPNGYNNNDLLIVMDWECLVDTTPMYIELGIDAAFQVWPQLQQLVDPNHNDLTWLKNKLHAISHVLEVPSSTSEISSSGASLNDEDDLFSCHHHPACEFALATRLILEEQVLDQNQSTGLNGKYAKQFHPRQDLKSQQQISSTSSTTTTNSSMPGSEETSTRGSRRSSTTGTRPLTVGEIIANWRDSIRETLTFKYHVNRQHPIPIIEEVVRQQLRSSKFKQQEQRHDDDDDDQTEQILHPYDSPSLFPDLKFALTHTGQPIIVTCRHTCDVHILRPCLERSNIPFHVIESIYDNHNDKGMEGSREDLLSAVIASDKTTSSTTTTTTMTSSQPVIVVTPQSIHRGQSSSSLSSATPPFILPDVLRHKICNGRTVVYVDAGWYRLANDAVPLFGDYMPRNGSNVAICGAVLHQNDDTTTATTTTTTTTKASSPTSPTRLSLYLAEWAVSTWSSSSSAATTSSTSPKAMHNDEALANPWTLPISWEDFERQFLTVSDNAFQ